MYQMGKARVMELKITKICIHISFKMERKRYRDSYFLPSQVEKHSFGIAKTKRMVMLCPLAYIRTYMILQQHAEKICFTILQFTCCYITALMLLLCHHGREKTDVSVSSMHCSKYNMRLV